MLYVKIQYLLSLFQHVNRGGDFLETDDFLARLKERPFS